MNNVLMLLIYSPFLVMTTILMGSVILEKHKRRFDYLYILSCLFLDIWAVLEMAPYFIFDQFWIEFFYTAKFVFIAFLPTLFLLLIVDFYNRFDTVKRWVFAITLAIPVSVALVAVSSEWNQLFFTSFTITYSPFTDITVTYSIWYYIALALIQIPTIGVLAILIIRRRKLQKVYHTTILLLLWAVLIYTVGVIVQVTGVLSFLEVNLSFIAVCIVNVLFYIAVSSNGGAVFLNVWRRDIFDYLGEPILIVDHNEKIVSVNKSAQKLFQRIDIAPIGMNDSELWSTMAANENVGIRVLEGEEGNVVSTDLYITEGRYPLIYALDTRDVSKKLGVGSGKYHIFNQATRNRLYIERLRDLAGVDTLTGLKNRFGYEQDLREYDTEENLPLSLIFGDVNGLKVLNDTHGHALGDELLIRVGKALETCCPPEGVVARIGGDEFVIVLKNHDEAQAQRIIEGVHDQVAQISDLPFDVSVALGSATKYTPEENINILSSQADAVMYADKVAGSH